MDGVRCIALAIWQNASNSESDFKRKTRRNRLGVAELNKLNNETGWSDFYARYVHV